MAHTFKWLVPERLLLIEMQGYFDKEELDTFNQELRKLGQAGQAPVHLLFDIARDFRSQINITVLKNSMPLGEAYFGWIVAISSSSTLQFFGKALSALTKFDLHMTRSADDAITFLQEKDATLPRQITLPER